MKHAVIIGFVLLLAASLWAADSQPKSVTLQLSSADVEDAVTQLSQQAQVAILGDSTVKGKVTCNLNAVTVDQALDLICKINKLTWVKAYISADSIEKPSASAIFKLMDALQELGGTTVIWEDAKAEQQTFYVPAAKTGLVDTAVLTTALKLKPVYLMRAEPDPAAKTVQDQPAGVAAPPPADVKAAAGQVWNYFTNMPAEQRWQVMRELGSMVMQNMTPEQREQMFRRDRHDGPRAPRDGRR